MMQTRSSLIRTKVTEEDFSSSECSTHETTDNDNNVMREVQKVSKQETHRIRIWRLVMTFIILATAAFVTFSTYFYLKDEERHNFENAFDQFSRTIGNAALQHQHNIRDAMESFANTITSYAMFSGAKWPYVTLPLYEKRAHDFRIQADSEMATVFPIVKHGDRDRWIEYATANYKAWYKEGHLLENGNTDGLDYNSEYHPFPSQFTAAGVLPDIERDFYAPSWQFSPPPFGYGQVNWNLISVPDYNDVVNAILELKNETCVSKGSTYNVAHSSTTNKIKQKDMQSKHPNLQTEHPHTFVFRPIHRTLDDHESDIVAILGTGIVWKAALVGILPDGVKGIHVVIKNNCNQSFTYEMNGRDAFFLGEGDKHEVVYDDMVVTVPLSLHTHPNFTNTPGHCRHKMQIYPSNNLQKEYESSAPEKFAIAIACTFVFVATVFFSYDTFVEQRNEKLVENAARSDAIVSSLFPSRFLDQLIGQKEEPNKTSRSVKAFLNKSRAKKEGKEHLEEKPLAELFLETTVLYADINGFTAWSSVREPTCVFKLLEAVFSSFDKIAKRHRVFKVETVGDCYVAVTGLPEPNSDHAVIMCRFARDIMEKMEVLTRHLEVTLGPDTADLSLRVGIHSGPVTGGVLRGDRSRFQLFGCTMNTAQRMESTGRPGHAHISSKTADLVCAAGKNEWLIERRDPISVIGKGVMQTFWLAEREDEDDTCTVYSVSSHTDFDTINAKTEAAVGVNVAGLSDRTCRLIDWNVETLLSLLKEIIARQNAKLQGAVRRPTMGDAVAVKTTPLDEVQEIIALPEFDKKAICKQKDLEKVDVPPAVIEQLQHYVSSIASMYHDNAFHNFEHASHVVMSVTKLLSRIVAPQDVDFDCSLDEVKDRRTIKKLAATLHDHTYGITSDPLTRFACAFSALIHDVDHTGVPNTQLIKENEGIATLYNNRSVAEQNSLDLSWSLLMSGRYNDLRAALFYDGEELKRFRQLVVNSVMATDICDQDLKALRNARWDKAFKPELEKEPSSMDFFKDTDEDKDKKDDSDSNEHIFEDEDEDDSERMKRRWSDTNIFDTLKVDLFEGNGRGQGLSVVRERNIAENLQGGARRRTSRLWSSLYRTESNGNFKEMLASLEQSKSEQNGRDAVNRKATIVIEHIIQASDVSHTMQHWHVYRQWNERLFEEMYNAYVAGRAEKDPSEFWYKGEIGFFDFYIIPLAKKLKECGVFGISSDEYLNYAMQNRQEWEARGESQVSAMTKKLKARRKKNRKKKSLGKISFKGL